jgi:hypothetical protein
MKKLFAVLAIAGVMAACNNSSDTDKTTTDSSTMTSDTASKMAPDTMNKMMPDTSKMSPDSLKK